MNCSGQTRACARALCAILLGAAGLAAALEFDSRPSAGTMAQTADRIVVARCVDSAPRADAKTGSIFTYSKFEVLESVKGRVGPAFTIRLFGGTVGNITDGAPGLPEFHQGEKVVLFLGPDNQDGYPALFLQGVYRTEQEPASGAWIVTDPIDDLPLFRAGTRTPISITRLSEPPITVEDFVYSIRQALR